MFYNLFTCSSGESANSLDQNEVLESEENGPASPQVEAEEQEMTLDLYDRGQFTGHQEQQHINNYRNMRHSSDADVPQVIQFLNAALEGEEDGEGETATSNFSQGSQIDGYKQETSRHDQDNREGNMYDSRAFNKNERKGKGKNELRYPNKKAHDNLSFGYHVESTEI